MLKQSNTKSLFNFLFTLLLFSSTLIFTGCTKNTPQTETAPSAVATPVPAATIDPNPSTQQTQTTTSQTSGSALNLETDATGLSKTTIVVKTAKGTVKFKFYPKDAPNTVNRFAELVQSKFYNGLLFHRVVPNFVAQTGDPKSKNKNDPTVGTGGSGKKLNAEFNERKHIRGTVAMARSADKNSADSQFYFTLGTYAHLDGNYTVFGQVTDFGEKVGDKDVLDRIRQGDEIIEMHLE